MSLTQFELVEIDQLETLDYSGDTWDLEVQDDHSYNIEGIVVHNSVCTTRAKTGVGYPQLSAIMETADAAHGLNGLVCGDGGCTVPGDVSKAFAAGADFVMLGGMLAGHDEGEGQIIEQHFQTNRIKTDKKGEPLYSQGNFQLEYETKKFVEFYGMSSDTAMIKYAGGVASYRASEGKTVLIPYKGPVDATVLEILGGIRSTMTYIGASNLKQMSKCATFVRVTAQLNEVFSK